MIQKLAALITIFIISFSLAAAAAEEGPAEGISMEEWSWDPQNVNNFTGTMDLSAYSGTELTLKIIAETDPAYEMNEKTRPVFTIVNGSRVRMIMQSDTLQFTPDAEHPALAFTGSIRMPEEPRVQRMTLTVKALNANGEELKSLSASVGIFDGGGGNSSGAFFIPYKAKNIALILAGAAILIWAAALIRNCILKRKK